MKQFFQGWRRKIGIVTLLMACVFMAEWVRSFHDTDMIMFPTNKALNRWISDKHGLLWTIHSMTDEEFNELEYDSLFGIPIPAICFAFPQTLDLSEQKCLNGNSWNQHSTFLDFEFLEGQIRGLETTARVWIIPHWSIVIPLTLVSACLLLPKPRQSNSKKAGDSVPIEAT